MEQQWIWQERIKPIFVCLPSWIILREEKSLFICPENPKESKQLLVPSPFLFVRHFVRFVFGHVPSANLRYIYQINTSNRYFFVVACVDTPIISQWQQSFMNKCPIIYFLQWSEISGFRYKQCYLFNKCPAVPPSHPIQFSNSTCR